ncbi:MAG: hypothetical protein ACTSUY_05955 [Alphaproteobacteria bacterium]
MIHGINGGKSIARDVAAKAQAAHRWQDQLLKRHHDQYEQLVPMITTELSDAATAAEMARRGAGLPCLLRALESKGLRYG